MQRIKPSRRTGGFTMVEMLVVIAIMGILAALLLPGLIGSKKRAKRIVCESQLQQIGIAFQSFAHDHNSKFPMQVSTNDGGSLEYYEGSNFVNGLSFSEYRSFQSLGGILASPKILVCPTDTRLPAANFITLQNSNVSYFAGLNASYDQPMSILAGDGNLTTSATIVMGTAGGRLTWNKELHEFKGNVLFSDGHVEEWKDGAGTLASAVTIALPTLGGGGGGSGGGGAASSSGSRSGGMSQPSLSVPSNSYASMQSAVAQSSPAASPSDNSTPESANPGMLRSSSRRNSTSAGAEQSEMDISNSIPEEVAFATNSPNTNVSSPMDVNSTMSPANRKAASILRDILGGSYLLILILVLTYLAYRIRRWRQEVERKRRQKLARAQLFSDS